MTDFDFIVIGSGAAGAAAAARLVQGGARTLLVEKGERATSPRDAMEAVYRYYTHGGLAAGVGNCLLPIPTGSVVGGTTTINSGTCLKTPAELLERWEKDSGGRFEAGAFRAYLDESWTRLNVTRAPEKTMSVSSRLFLEGLDRLGTPGGHRLDRAEKGCVGSGRCCFVCPSGGKMTADKAFLAGLSGSRDFELATGTELTGLDVDDEVSVSLRSKNGARRVGCRAVVLACGALASPYFARKLGHRKAGGALSVHPAAKVFAYFDEPLGDVWKGVPQGAGLVDPEEPRIHYEGVHTPPELSAITMPLEGGRLRWWMERHDRVASFGFMIRDQSRGSVRYPFGGRFPAIFYRMSREDLGLMLRAMRTVGKVFFAAGARRVLLPLNRPDNEFGSAAELEAADFPGVSAAQLQMMAFHPLGTCGMGRVVDENLRLEPGVHVADGSVIPEAIGVNPQITIYSFALRLGDHLLKTYAN